MSACVALITRGPNKGLTATGTWAGYQRHIRAGEPPCNFCLASGTEYGRRRRETNPERQPEYMRRYYATNREKKVVYARRWYEANRERHAENARRWARANPEKMAESRRRWNVANREKVAERVRRRRARKAAVLTISFTTEQLAQRMAFWGNQCWMCGGPFEEVDHVIPIALGGPHCLSNLRPACKSCNSSKGARRLEGVA